VKVDQQRLLGRIAQLAELGATPGGGINRPAYGPAHAQAVARVAQWAQEAGLEVGLDTTGNLIVTLAGEHPERPAIALGSHLDTVPNGGAFDGALGVLAGLEVLQTLREQRLPLARPLTLIAFADEEGNNFGIGVLSAQLWIGAIPPERYAEILDREGRSLADTLEAFTVPGVARVKRPELAGYLELHVEQGPVLDREGGVAAAVTGIVGISRTTVRFVGEANHAGTTPMALRKDALWGGAELALKVRELALATAAEAVGTVGLFEVSPGATNVVPGGVELRIELRSLDEGLLTRLRGELELFAAELAERHGLRVSLEPWHHSPAVPMHPVALQATEQALGDAGLPARSMPSWAGHDAKILARRMPTGMIFVPSRGGYSHSPLEDTDGAHCAAGAEVLLHAALRLVAEPSL
jgi:N-carbamoyl-L-amino-acid hydrolase